MTEKQQKEFIFLAESMIKYLNDNHHPHTKVIIDCASAEIMEGLLGHVTEEFMHD